MDAIIYRGTNEIGGTLIELRSEKTRLLLDTGYPLFLNNKPIENDILRKDITELLELGVLPKIEGLYQWDNPNVDAILISHAHLDHYGLLKYVHSDIPVYLSNGTNKLIEISQIFGICEQYKINTNLFNKNESFNIGDFSIKPYLMDHSAFDAYAFEISCNSKTIIYSGDFRGHGRNAYYLDNFIKSATKNVDRLFIEGTIFSGRTDENIMTEEKLEDYIVNKFEGKEGAILFQTSSQNIDRLISFYNAAHRLGRIFAIDIYTANILYKLNKLKLLDNIPYPSKKYKDIKVFFFPDKFRRMVYDDERYSQYFSRFHYAISYNKIRREQLKEKQNKIMMFVRASMQKDLEKCDFSDGHFIYSLWDGYRDTPYQESFENYLEEKGFKIDNIHTSGHASVKDICRLIEGLNPNKITPIHTMCPNAFLDYFDNVSQQKDGEIFAV